jgi:hypothetical protein
MKLIHVLPVTRGLDPRVHFFLRSFLRRWIAGASPAMTAEIQPKRKPLWNCDGKDQNY